jgi:hypothetical protein
MFTARARSKMFYTMTHIIEKCAQRNRIDPLTHNTGKTDSDCIDGGAP